MIKYVGLVVIYKIIDPHNYLLMTLDEKILRGLFEHKRIKPANINNQGNVNNLVQLKQIMNAGIKIKKYKDKSILYCLNHNIKTMFNIL